MKKNLLFSLLIFVIGLWINITHYPHTILYFLLLLIPLIKAGILFFVGYLIGEPLVRWFRFKTFKQDTDVLIAIVLGTGILSYISLFLGALHLYHKIIISLLFIIIILLSFRKIEQCIRGIVHWYRTFGFDKLSFEWIIVVALFSIVMLLYIVTMLAPPISYDVLEYHLAVPQHYIQEGGLTAEPYNFYANMPFGIEMLYTLGILLEGGHTYFTPKIINFGFLILTLMLLNNLLLELGCISSRIRALTMLFYLSLFVTYKISADAYADLGITVYIGTAILLWLIWLNTLKRRYVVFSGIFLGFASACKYPAIGIFVLPFLITLLPMGTLYENILLESMAGKGINVRKAFKIYAILFVIVSITIVFFMFPWLVKNIFYTHNPFYPFFGKIFGGKWMDLERSGKIISLHGSVPILSMEYISAVWGKIRQIEFLLFMPLLLIFFRGINVKEKIVMLFVYLFIGIFVWSWVANSPDRFFASGYLILAAMVGWMLQIFSWRKVFFALAAVPYLVYVFFQTQLLFININEYKFIPYALGTISGKEYLEYNLNEYYKTVTFINEQLPRDAKILFVYEARTLYVKRDVIANTVHNFSPLYEIARRSNSAAEIIAKLKEEGIEYVFVNEIELQRLEKTFGDYYPYDDFKKINPLLQEFFSTIFDKKIFLINAPQGEYEGKRLYISYLSEQ